MKHYSLKLSLILGLLILGTALSAQNITVSGIVLDAQTQEPVPGAAILVQGEAANGVAAGNDGRYSISVSKDATLVCSCFGYEDAAVKVNGRAVLDFQLKVDAVMLDETVVVGYGTLKKSQLVGSVEQLSGEALEDRVTPNIARSLQGQIPGLNIIQPDGKPTHTGEIYIRGNSTSYVVQGNGGKADYSIGQGGTALILIDGVEGDLSMVNPDDIESVTVLKDASSSVIYGARAAYGVILITTKNAQKETLKVTYNASVSLHQRTILWEDNIVTDGLTYLETYFEHFINYSDTPQSPGARPSSLSIYEIPTNFLEQYRDWYEGKIPVPDTSYSALFTTGQNYLAEFYKRMNTSTTHNLSISGSAGKVSYLVSGRYYGQDAVYKVGNENFNSYNLRAKINVQATKTLSFDNNTSFSRNSYIQPIFTKGSSSVGSQLHQIAMVGFPVMPLYNADGTYTHGAAAGGYASFKDGNSAQEEDKAIFTTSLGATWNPIKDVLKFRGEFAFKNVNRNIDRYGAPVYESSAPGTLTPYISQAESYKRFFNYNTDYISANAVATYTPNLGKSHNLNLVAGWNLEHTVYHRRGTMREGLISPSHPNFELMDGTEVTLWDDGYSFGLVGYFARANYTLFDRYIFEVSARYDGSSKFPPHQQWGFFPSGSIGWRISEEPWMKEARSWLNNLKLRANAGSLGNGNISPYAYLSTMGVSKSSIPFDDALVNRITAPAIVPDNLTWETVTTYDIGLDMDVLKSRLSFSGDYYIRNTTDLYVNGPEVPAIFGASSPKGNYGALQTRGWEATVSWRDSFKLAGKEFTYSIKGSLWDSRTWVTSFNNDKGTIYNYYEGKELGEIWGFPTGGYFMSNEEAKNWYVDEFHTQRPASGPYAGSLKFLDSNSDHKISAGSFTLDSHGDLERIGNCMPRFQYGLNLDFSWNGIGLSMFIQGVGKRDWYPTKGSDFFWGSYARAQIAYVPKTQSKENTVQIDKSTENWVVTNAADKPYWTRTGYSQAHSDNSPLTFPNDYYLQNAAYVRLKNLTIDYSFPKQMLSRAKIEQLRVYVTGENLFTWSPMFKNTQMFDPEVIQGGDTDFHGATDVADGYSYPMLRTITFGASITF